MGSRFIKSNIKLFWRRTKELFVSVKRHWRHIYYSQFLIGLLSLIWFAFRTGTKPSRAAYPCQQAAAASGYLWLVTIVFPVFSAVRHRKFTSLVRKGSIIALAAAVVIVPVFWVLNENGGNPSLDLPGQAIELNLNGRLAEATTASDIFVVSGTSGYDSGVAQLIDLMGSHGTSFHSLIASDDTVIIKVNSQWDERGGTNTDVLKALIGAIIQHPGGFDGEIVVADNGQGSGSFTRSENNAEDISQSVQQVVDSFSGYRVSTYLWDNLWKEVNEYSAGDLEDGYVLNHNINPRTGLIVSYPKFTTKFGTYISFKLGIWNPDTQVYDSEHLKVINVPVLKCHYDYGVTACIKNYMGVTSNILSGNLGGRAHDSVGRGGMGTEMVETRFPTLNILDAVYVNAVPRGGPQTPYDKATKTSCIAASTDPAALDYWAAKNILVPTAQSLGYTDVSSIDPDNTATGSFGDWLRLSMGEIVRAGYNSTVDETHMNVFVSELQPTPTSTPTPTPTSTPTPTPTSTPTPTLAPTPSPTPTLAPTPSPTPTLAPTPSPAPVGGGGTGVGVGGQTAPTATPASTPTLWLTPTHTPTSTSIEAPKPTPTPTATPAPTFTSTPELAPTASPEVTATPIPIQTQSGGGVNWSLVGGIIGGLAVISTAMYLLLLRKRAAASRHN